jgi:hypothetical protein
MATYWIAGGPQGDCGHHHRTRAGAEKCARTWLWSQRRDIEQEATEHGQTYREYVDCICAERNGGMIMQISD